VTAGSATVEGGAATLFLELCACNNCEQLTSGTNPTGSNLKKCICVWENMFCFRYDSVHCN